MTVYSVSPVRFNSVSMVTATLGANDPELGTVVRVGMSEYQLCYNAGAAAIKVGWGGFHNSMNSGASVTVSNAASQTGNFVGVCYHASIPAGSYGWLVTKGLTYVAADGSETSAASGIHLNLGVDGGFVATTATLSTGLPVGITVSTMQTQGTTTPGKAFIYRSVLG